MSVPAERRVVVGVDGSAESVAALRWACREASLRDAEVHAVRVREELCHSLPGYAAPAVSDPDDLVVDDLVRLVQAEQAPDLKVRIEVVDGLVARVLLDRSAGADMLVLGTANDTRRDTHGAHRSAGPVIRACLRRAACPVVVISAAQDPAAHPGSASRAAGTRVPAGV